MCEQGIICRIRSHTAIAILQVLKDWQLIVATLIVTGISVVLLTLEAAVPQLRGEVTVEEDGERAFGTTVKSGFHGIIM